MSRPRTPGRSGRVWSRIRLWGLSLEMVSPSPVPGLASRRARGLGLVPHVLWLPGTLWAAPAGGFYIEGPASHFRVTPLAEGDFEPQLFPKPSFCAM